MLGRGVKRKWSCVEDIHTPAKDGEQQQDGSGVEDAADFSEPADLNHLQQQRQRVFGLCLQKLQRYRAGMDLSLRRSVLLINTLRQLQEDIQSDPIFLDGDVSVTCSGCSDPHQGIPPELPEPSPQNSDPQRASPDAVSTTGYLSDFALDDIFDDIDTSMYESADLPSAWAMGSLWPVSVSLWADEDFKMRPQNTGGHQSCLMDLNELDHIMEILVKS